VFAGCFLEGETVLVLAGLAAHLGYLSLPWVIITAATAGFAGDETAYLAGRRYGDLLLSRFPSLRRARRRVHDHLVRHGTALVFFIRFLVGMRVAGPVLIGASRALGPLRFAVPNAAGALFWAIVVGGAGFVFGAAFTGFIEHARRYEEWAFAAIGAAMLVAFVVRRAMHARHSGREDPDGGTLPAAAVPSCAGIVAAASSATVPGSLERTTDMRRENRPDSGATTDPAPEEPALLRPPGGDARPLPHSEHNSAGYQETPIKPSTAEADSAASDNCALLHRARKESDEGCAPAEDSPGHADDPAAPGSPRRPR
jgi:membrane protein DedA with SNARE-associated domain